MKRTHFFAALVAIVATPAVAHSSDHHDHHHSSYSAGEPGDPGETSRTVEVEMTEMAFSPFKVDVERGEQIKFVIRNAGKEDHEFLLATTAENLKHAEAMRKNPGMAHDEPNGVRLAPSKSAEVLWRFSKKGTFEYSCLISNHRELGMTGEVTVK